MNSASQMLSHRHIQSEQSEHGKLIFGGEKKIRN